MLAMRAAVYLDESEGKVTGPGGNAAPPPSRSLRQQRHPKILLVGPQKASLGSTLARGASADPAGHDGEGQARGIRRQTCLATLQP